LIKISCIRNSDAVCDVISAFAPGRLELGDTGEQHTDVLKPSDIPRTNASIVFTKPG